MNTFGTRLKITGFGESHGKTIGVVLDGMPSNVKFGEEFLQNELDKRKGGSKFVTPRKESDEAEILSEVFEGFTTGQPIAIFFRSENTRSKDYSELKSLFRPSHADFSCFQKYGIRDYKGEGRSSARENVARVAAGVVATMFLGEFNVEVLGGVFGVGECVSILKNSEFDFELANKSETLCLDRGLEENLKQEILETKEAKDNVRAAVFTKVSGVRAGLGEVLYDKLGSKLARALMGIDAVRAVEIGSGISSSQKRGSQNNDSMQNGKFLSSHSGGILEGISSGDLIKLKNYFKPTPSIFLAQETMNEDSENVLCELSDRHDPYVGIRGSVVANVIVRFMITDALFLNTNTDLHHLKAIYKS